MCLLEIRSLGGNLEKGKQKNGTRLFIFKQTNDKTTTQTFAAGGSIPFRGQ